MKGWFTNNIGLKLLSLSLAVISWFYIMGIMTEKPPRKILPLKPWARPQLSAKYVPVKPKIEGEPKAGYRVAAEKISINPKVCLIVAPAKTVEMIDSVNTMSIDVAGLSRTVIRTIPLEVIEGQRLSGESLVEVTIPIERER